MSASVRAVLSFWDISFFSAFAERREGGAPKDQVLEEVDVRQKENQIQPDVNSGSLVMSMRETWHVL